MLVEEQKYANVSEGIKSIFQLNKKEEDEGDVKNEKYNKDVDITSLSDSDLTPLQFAAKELALTMSDKPDITDEEIFELFPEFNNNPDILKSAKSMAFTFGGDALKKKDTTVVSEDSSEDVENLESETPSTSKDRQTLDNITSKWPALKNLGDIVLNPDESYDMSEYGAGFIEYQSPEQGAVTYAEGVTLEHPSPGNHAITYNPNKTNEQSIKLDMLHAMHSIPEYKGLYDEFATSFKSSKFEGEIKRSYKASKAEGYKDSYEVFETNFIDGIIRNLLFEGTPEDFKKHKYWDKASEVYLSDENIKSSFNELKTYLETGGEETEKVEFSEKDLKRAQSYIDKDFAADETVNKEAYDYLLSQQKPQKEIIPEIPSDFDSDVFKQGIIRSEATGYLTGTPDNLDDKDYSISSKHSSAVGPYQIRYNEFKDILKDKWGIKSKKEFIGNKKVQEEFMSYMLENKPGRYTYMANRIQKDYSEYIPKDMSYQDLVSLQHFIGHGNSRKLFAKVRDNKDFNSEDVYDFIPKGKNMSVGDYLKKMSVPKKSKEKEEPTGMLDKYGNYINPLDDPNLTAGGDDAVQAYVNSQIDDDEEEEKKKKKKSGIRYVEVLDADGTPIKIPEGRPGQSSEEYRKELNEAFESLANSETIEENNRIKKSLGYNIIDRAKEHGTTITAEEFQIVLGDAYQKFEESRLETYQKVIESIDNNKDMNPLNKGFIANVTELVKTEHLYTLHKALMERNIDLHPSQIDSERLKILPHVLHHYYSKLGEGDAYQEFVKYIEEKGGLEEIHKLNVEAWRSAIGGEQMVISNELMGGGVIEDAFGDIKDMTPAERSKYIINAAHHILEREKYDDIPESWISEVANVIANKYHKESPEYKDIEEEARVAALAVYNEENNTDYDTPGVEIQGFQQTIMELNESDLTVQEKVNIIKDKHNIIVKANGAWKWTDDYKNVLNDVIQKSDDKVWKKYVKDNGMEKFHLAEVFENSLAGQLFTLFIDRPINPEWGVEYSELENFIIGVGSVAFDLAIPVIGSGVGKVKSVKIAQQRAWLNEQKLIKIQQFRNQGMKGKQLQNAIIRADLAMEAQLAKYATKTGYYSSAATLGTWFAAMDMTAQYKETHDVTEIHYSDVLLEGAKGGVLGPVTFGIARGTQRINKYVKDRGLPLIIEKPLLGYTWFQGVAVEAGAFMTAESIAHGTAPSFELYKDNLAFILGLRFAKMPFTLAQHEAWDFKKSNKGPYSFKLTEAEREYMGIDSKLNDAQVYNALVREMNKSEKSAEAMMNIMPMSVLSKYIWANVGGKINLSNPLDAVGVEYRSVEGKPNVVEAVNSQGEVLFVERFKSEKEVIEYINKKNTEAPGVIAREILEKDVLTIESKAKLKAALDKLGVTRERAEEILNQEKKNPEEQVVSDAVSEAVKNVYAEQKTKQDKQQKEFDDAIREEAVKVLEKNNITKENPNWDELLAKEILTQTEKALKQAEVIQTEKLNKAAEILLEQEQKEAAGIKETDNWMIRVNLALGKKPEAPIEVTADNIKILRESAITDNQKAAVEDIIKATESLKNLKGKVIVHTDNASYQQVLDAVEKGNIANVTGGHRNLKTGDIHYNLNAVNKWTATHEAGHAWTETIREKNPEKYQKIEDKVYELIKDTPEYAGILDFISTKTEGGEFVYKTEQQQKNEALVEFSARVAKGDYKIKENNKFVNKAKIQLNKLMESIGVEYRFATNDEVISFVNKISKQVGKGKVLEEQVLIEGFKDEANLTRREEVSKDMPKNQLRVNQSKKQFEKEIKDIIEKKKGSFANITAQNPGAKELSPAENAERNKKLYSRLVEMGYKPILIQGKHGVAEDSFYVKGITIKDAVKLGKEFGQESVAHSEGLLYTSGKNEGKMQKSTGKVEFNQDVKDYYSIIETKEGGYKYQIGYEESFENIPYEQVRGEYTYSSMVRGEKAGRKESDFNAGIESIKEGYSDNIMSIEKKYGTSIPGDKQKNKEIKRVKKDLIKYIKGSDYLSKGVKKSVLEEAVKIKTSQQLDRFISNVEEMSEAQSLSSNISHVNNLGKKVKKKQSKGLYGDKSKLVEEFLNKDFSQITDPALVAEVNNILVDLNRRKQPLVNPKEIEVLTEKLDNVIGTIEASQPKIQGVEKLNTRMEKIESTLKDAKFDVTSTEGANEVISLGRSIEALKKSLYLSETEGKISLAESQKIQEKIIKLSSKIQGKVTEFNTERFNLSKNILKNSDLSSYNKYQREIIEKLKEVDFVDNIGYNDNMYIASINISNGFPPINNISKLLVEANNGRHGNNLSDLLSERIDKWAGKKKYGVGKTGLWSMIPTNSKLLQERMGYRPLSLISEFFRAEADVEHAGLIDKAIIAPLTRSFSRHAKGVRMDINEWQNIYSSKLDKVSNWMMDETSGRILAIPFTQKLNPLYHKKQSSDNKIGVILAQIERNSHDGQNVLKTIIENKSLFNHYSKSEQLYLKTIYKNLPKKTVDGKEVIDIDAAIKGLTKREKKILDKFREFTDNVLSPKQQLANELRGIPFEVVENYFPHILKPGQKTPVVATEFEQWAENIFINNSKIQSDAGKQRTSTDILAYEFNVNKVMMDRIMQVNRDYYLTQTINEVRELINNGKLNSGKDYHMYFDALSNRMREAVELDLHRSSSLINQELLSPFMTATYSTKLLRPGRLAGEAVSETIRVGIGASERPFQDLPNSFKSVADRAETNIYNSTKIAEDLYLKTFSQNSGKNIGKENMNTVLNEILKMTDSPFIHRYSRWDVEFGKEVGREKGYLNKFSNWGLSLVDRNTLFMAYMPAFNKEFKSITGKEFDYSAFRDPKYKETHKQAILDAAAIGDRAAAQWKNIAVKGAAPSKIRTPLSLFDLAGVKRTSEWAPVLTYMSSFGALETAMYQKSIRDVMSGESANTKALGGKRAVAILGAGITYGTIIGLEIAWGKHLMDRHIIETSDEYDAMNKYDKEQALKAVDDEWNEYVDGVFKVSGLKKQIVSNTAFLVNSKYSQAMRMSLVGFGGAYQQWLKSDESTREFDKSALVEESEATKQWLSEIMGEDGNNVDALLRGGIYAKPAADVGGVAEQMLPHIDMAMEVMIKDFPKDFWEWYQEGHHDQLEGAALTHAKYRDELQFANLVQQGIRMYFMFRGTAVPGDRYVSTYYKEMMKRYNYPTVPYFKMKGEGHGEPAGFGKPKGHGKR